MVRLKHRYLLVNILYPDATTTTKPTKGNSAAQELPSGLHFHAPSSDALTAQLLVRAIRDGIADLFGDYGSGMVGGSLVVKYLSTATSTAIIRVARAHYRLVWAALTYMTRLPRPVDQPCVMQVVRVSGTIRKSEEEAVRRAKASILRAHRAGRGVGADAVLGMLAAGVDDGLEGRDVVMAGIEDEDDEDEDEDDEED